MIKLAVQILGRRLAWRLGRALYMAARGESDLGIETDGEAGLIRTAARLWRADGIAPVVWDVGGNLGEWSANVVAASDGFALRLHIFEPAPAARAALAKRFDGDARVSIHALALSDREGVARFRIDAPTAGTNALLGDAEAAGETIEVSVSTGDRQIETLSLDCIDLIKIDAEGFDYSVLTGLRGALAARRVAVVQFEYNHLWIDQHVSLRSVFALIDELPYRLARIDPDGPEAIAQWNPELDRYFAGNYALIREDMLARLGVRMADWDAFNVLEAR